MRRAAEAWRISGDGLIPVLAVTAACFLLGGLVGCLLASHIGGGGQESLAAYVEGFLRAAQAGEFGGVGCLLALLVFGVSGALSVPVLFVLGVQGLLAARVLAGRVWGDGKTPPPYGKLYFFRCGACAVALCVSLLLDCFVVPGLVSSLAGTFLSL